MSSSLELLQWYCALVEDETTRGIAENTLKNVAHFKGLDMSDVRQAVDKIRLQRGDLDDESIREESVVVQKSIRELWPKFEAWMRSRSKGKGGVRVGAVRVQARTLPRRLWELERRKIKVGGSAGISSGGAEAQESSDSVSNAQEEGQDQDGDDVHRLLSSFDPRVGRSSLLMLMILCPISLACFAMDDTDVDTYHHMCSCVSKMADDALDALEKTGLSECLRGAAIEHYILMERSRGDELCYRMEREEGQRQPGVHDDGKGSANQVAGLDVVNVVRDFMRDPSKGGHVGQHFMLPDWQPGKAGVVMRMWRRKRDPINEAVGVVFFGLPVVYEGPPGHVHGGCLAAVGDIAAAMVGATAGALTLSLEITYKSAVPVCSCVTFSGVRQPWKERPGYLIHVEFRDLQGDIKFLIKAVFARPKGAPKL